MQVSLSVAGGVSLTLDGRVTTAGGDAASSPLSLGMRSPLYVGGYPGEFVNTHGVRGKLKHSSGRCWCRLQVPKSYTGSRRKTAPNHVITGQRNNEHLSLTLQNFPFYCVMRSNKVFSSSSFCIHVVDILYLCSTKFTSYRY